MAAVKEAIEGLEGRLWRRLQRRPDLELDWHRPTLEMWRTFNLSLVHLSRQGLQKPGKLG